MRGETEMKKILAFSKIYLFDTLQAKLAFIFNLAFPVGFFVIDNFKVIGKGTINEEKLVSVLSVYIAYIILVSLLNLVIMPILAQREQGMFLEYTLISGNKLYPFWGLLGLQVCVLLLELIVFDITVYALFPKRRWDDPYFTDIAGNECGFTSSRYLITVVTIENRSAIIECYSDIIYLYLFFATKKRSIYMVIDKSTSIYSTSSKPWFFMAILYRRVRLSSGRACLFS